MHPSRRQDDQQRTRNAERVMHKVKVVRSFYDQSEPYVGRIGEVIGHWGADNNDQGRDGFMVQFDDGTVVGVSENEVEDVAVEEGDVPPAERPDAIGG